MKAKDGILILISGGILVSLIILITRPPAAPQSQPQPSQATPVDDHHKPQPTNSAVFESLLNKSAPDFSLPEFDGKNVSLKDFRGKNVILFFNEGLMCYPACWNQVVAFGQDKNFGAKNTVILNITVDSKDDWKKAIDKMPELSGNTVLLDPDRSVSNLYGILTLNSSMHRGQFPGHTYIIIDKDGVVRFTKDDAEMAVRNEELLDQIEKL